MNCYMISDGDTCLGYGFAKDAGLVMELAEQAHPDKDMDDYNAYSVNELYDCQYVFNKPRAHACYIDCTDTECKEVKELAKRGFYRNGRFFNKSQ